ncbi:hypothetical protein D9V86_13025 [Bacteroidetes/Chlorobi group bacterium ChocPot_Mid]|jgi:hypothetical protein|nr:MAG: hypothetical protein D9V86_13025 [Bacteroidetes/Chlorobi group bacterium ChocPot_Mid]
MKKHIIVALVLISTAFSGCLVLSLFPIYTKDTLVKLDALEGTWMQRDSSLWTFAFADTSNPDNLKMYELIVNETYQARKGLDTNIIIPDSLLAEFATSKFEAGITLINGIYFLDLLADKSASLSGFHTQHFINGHSISKITLKDDTLWISSLDDDWAKRLKPKERKKYGLLETRKNWILTLQTKPLRDFLAKVAKDTNVFPEPNTYLIKVKN